MGFYLKIFNITLWKHCEECWFNCRTMWRACFGAKAWHYILGIREVEGWNTSYFRDGVSGMTTATPKSFSPSLYQPPPTLNLEHCKAQNFSDYTQFSPLLYASQDKYRPLLLFPNELRHTRAPPNHAWDCSVYKGHGWVAAGESEIRGQKCGQVISSNTNKEWHNRKRKKGAVCIILYT